MKTISVSCPNCKQAYDTKIKLNQFKKAVIKAIDEMAEGLACEDNWNSFTSPYQILCEAIATLVEENETDT
jgi:hypothetical protein